MLEDRTRPGQGDRVGGSHAPLGSHVSAQGGVEHVPARADEIGADAVQIFTSAPQRSTISHAPALTSARPAAAAKGVHTVVASTPVSQWSEAAIAPTTIKTFLIVFPPMQSLLCVGLRA